MEEAPIATTLVAAAVQSIPLVIILYGRSPLFDGTVRRGVGCALVVFAPHINHEVWLTTLQSQVWLRH